MSTFQQSAVTLRVIADPLGKYDPSCPLWTWDLKTEALFMGEWCFSHPSPVPFVDQDKYPMVPYPWQSSQALQNGVEELATTTNILEKFVVNALVTKSAGKNNEQFWTVRLAPWLAHWTSMALALLHRIEWLRNEASRRGAVVEFYFAHHARSLDQLIGPHPIETSLDYQQVLILDLLKGFDTGWFRLCFPDSEETKTSRIPSSNNEPRGGYPSWHDKIKSTIRNLLEHLHAKSDIMIGDVAGISPLDRIIMMTALDPAHWFRQVPKIQARKPISLTKFSEADLSPLPDRVKALARMLPRHIPPYRLADYEGGRIPAIWVGIDPYLNTARAWRTAMTVQNGGLWFASQHGACYGQIAVSTVARLESEKATAFLSWGWTQQHCLFKGKIIPLPSPKLSKLPRWRGGNRLLFLSNGRPIPTYRIHSDIMPHQLAGYIHEKRTLLALLSPETRKLVDFRPFPESYGTDEVAWVTDGLIASSQVLNGDVSLLKVMARSRLFIIDHLGTSLLEALVMGAPSVAYWQRDLIEISPVAKRFFDELKSVGILHDSAADCARFVEKLLADGIQQWWSSETVQKAVDRFVREYCLNDSRWRSKWIQFLKTEAKNLSSKTSSPNTHRRHT